VPSPPGELAARLGIEFRDPRLLEPALVHSSYVNEHPENAARSNERLEFLGDAVLSHVISEALWRLHDDETEGQLTTRRAAIVSARGLARVSLRLGIGDHLVVGQGAERSGERRRGSVLASTFEALIAAVYLDGGIDVVRDLLLRVFEPELAAIAPPASLQSPKSRLQELAYAVGGRPPAYRVVSVQGPDHARHYAVEVSVGGRVMGRVDGRSRRDAETEAAARALVALANDGAAGPGTATADTDPAAWAAEGVPIPAGPEPTTRSADPAEPGAFEQP
jgi:ribonuclease-3